MSAHRLIAAARRSRSHPATSAAAPTAAATNVIGCTSRTSAYSAPTHAYPHQLGRPLGPTNRTGHRTAPARVPVHAHAQQVSPTAKVDG
ncbi:hypothetical protein [Streptomyces sp. NPDC051677]|uniref:hypothetical protein n=1 Tax=Streptomyces sp. NPDC051677 TaxID=3365669 RepID=UPI0037D51D9B